jgi:hypothetical protein
LKLNKEIFCVLLFSKQYKLSTYFFYWIVGYIFIVVVLVNFFVRERDKEAKGGVSERKMSEGERHKAACVRERGRSGMSEREK